MKTKSISLLFLMLYGLTCNSQPIPGGSLFKNPTFSNLDLSPSGEWVVGSYIGKKNTPHLVMTSTQKTSVHSLIKMSDEVSIENYSWIDDNNIYIRFSGAEHKEALIKLNIFDGKPSAQIYKIKHKGYLLTNIKKNEEMIYAAYKTDKKIRPILYKITTDDLILDEIPKNKKYKFQKNGAFFYLAKEKGEIYSFTRNGKNIKVFSLNLNTNNWEEIFEYSDQDFYFNPVGRLTEKTVAVLSDYGQDLVSLMQFNIETKSFEGIIYQHDKYDLYNAIYNSEKNQVEAAQYFDHGELVTHYFSTKSRQLSDIFQKKFSGKNVYIMDESDNKKIKLLGVGSSSSPLSYYYYDEDKQFITYIDSAYPKLKDIKFSKTKKITVNTSASKPIEAFLSQPGIKNDLGVLIVMPHGGPIGVQETDFFNREVQYYTSRGYAVLRVNFRGSAGYGNHFQMSGVGEFGKAIEEDISSAVDLVTEKYGYKRACAMGASYGAYSAMMLAIAKPKFYRCVVAMFGIYDLSLLFSESNLRQDSEYIKWVENAVGKQENITRTFSPVYRSNDIKSPVLLVAGKKDRVAPFEHTKRMQYMLKENNKDVETLFFRHVGHGHNTWKGDQQTAAYADDFIRRKLELPSIKDSADTFDYIRESEMLGYLFWTPKIVERNLDLSFKYYLNSANAGSGSAMYSVANFYRYGNSVARDINEAIKWYKTASQLGFSSASYALGEIYGDGEVVQQNFKKSISYFLKAKKQGRGIRAQIQAGKNHCLDKSEDKQFYKCLELLDLNISSLSKMEKLDLENSFIDILYKGYFSTSEQNRLKTLINKMYGSDIKNGYSITPIELNIRGKKISFRRINNGKVFSINQPNKNKNLYSYPNRRIRYTFLIQADTPSPRDELASFFIRWSKIEEGVRQVKNKTILSGKHGDKRETYYYIGENETLSDWELEILDINQKLLTRIPFSGKS